MKSKKEFNKKFGKNSLDVLLMLKIQASLFDSFKIGNDKLTEFANISEISLCKTLNKFEDSQFIKRDISGFSNRVIFVNELPKDIDHLLYSRYKELNIRLFDTPKESSRALTQPALALH
jgi:hypothetical protein